MQGTSNYCASGPNIFGADQTTLLLLASIFMTIGFVVFHLSKTKYNDYVGMGSIALGISCMLASLMENQFYILDCGENVSTAQVVFLVVASILWLVATLLFQYLCFLYVATPKGEPGMRKPRILKGLLGR